MSSNESSKHDGLRDAVNETDATSQFETIDGAREAMLDAVTAALGGRDALNTLRDLAVGEDAVLPPGLGEMLQEVAQLQVQTMGRLSEMSARYTARLARSLRDTRPGRAPKPPREALLTLDGRAGETASGAFELENRCARELSLELPPYLMFHSDDGRLPVPARFTVDAASERRVTLPAAAKDKPSQTTANLSMTIDPLRFSAGRYTATLELSEADTTRNILHVDLVVHPPEGA